MNYKMLDKLFPDGTEYVHMAEAIASGISRRQFYAWRDQGLIKPISRGIYCLAKASNLSMPDLAIVSLRFPKSVICLLSALSYHGLTTHIPHVISVAVTTGTRLPRLDFPPVESHRYNKASFFAGIDVYKIDNISVQIYNPEKTIVDCFKFRHKIGMDILLEALNCYKKKFSLNTNTIMEYAKLCRMEKIITPYMESLLCL